MSWVSSNAPMTGASSPGRSVSPRRGYSTRNTKVPSRNGTRKGACQAGMLEIISDLGAAPCSTSSRLGGDRPARPTSSFLVE